MQLQELFNRSTLVTVGLAASIALSGCANRPAGSQIDEGGFGNPTMQNTQVHNGEIAVLQDLSARFNTDVPSTINFAFNSARIDASAAAVLRRQADFMNAFPEARFSVYGHTDAVGSDAYNQGLSLDRAKAVKQFLVDSGVEPAQIETLAMGKTKPRRPNVTEDGEDDPTGRRANRRTEIYLNF